MLTLTHHTHHTCSLTCNSHGHTLTQNTYAYTHKYSHTCTHPQWSKEWPRGRGRARETDVEAEAPRDTEKERDKEVAFRPVLSERKTAVESREGPGCNHRDSPRAMAPSHALSRSRWGSSARAAGPSGQELDSNTQLTCSVETCQPF